MDSIVELRVLAFRNSQSPSPSANVNAASGSLEGPSDEQLLFLIKSNDQIALGLLFERYARIAYRIGQKLLHDDADAEDFVQDLFLYLRRKSGVYDSAKGSARSWIVQTIYYQAFQRRRQLTIRRQVLSPLQNNFEDNDLASLLPPVYERSLEGTIGRTKLREIVGMLSDDQWDTLRLHFFEGYTLSEIAEKKRQTLGNIRHHFYRGLEKLRSSVFRSNVKGRISSDKEMSGLRVKAL